MARLILIIIFATGLFACTPQSKTEAIPAGQAPMRIIIGFNDFQQNPQDKKLLSSLEKDLNGKIRFLQSASGNAAVYECSSASTKEELVEALNKLGSRADINYAEPDERRQIQSGAK